MEEEISRSKARKGHFHLRTKKGASVRRRIHALGRERAVGPSFQDRWLQNVVMTTSLGGKTCVCQKKLSERLKGSIGIDSVGCESTQNGPPCQILESYGSIFASLWTLKMIYLSIYPSLYLAVMPTSPRNSYVN